MSTLKALEVPIKSGETIITGRLELGTVIKHLTLPTLSGGVVTDVTYDLPSGGSVTDAIVLVETDPASLFNGKTCYLKNSGGTVIDQQTIVSGKTRFDIADPGTYIFSVTI